MIQTIEKWRVIIEFMVSSGPVIFYISDDHFQNVLRQLAVMGFENEVINIKIERMLG